MSDTERTVRSLEGELHILYDRIREITNAIALLNSLKDAEEQGKKKRNPRSKAYRMENIKGVVLGNIPVKPRVNKGKRSYTKKSEFWSKPHPRKKK